MGVLSNLRFGGYTSDLPWNNFYTKLETYTKEEIEELIAQIETSSFVEVDVLPAIGDDGIIYLVPDGQGGKEQWIYSNGAWISLGNTNIDLSDYVRKTELLSILTSYAQRSELADYVQKTELVNTIYPVGSYLTMSTNTNPSTRYPDTTWQLVDKLFRPTGIVEITETGISPVIKTDWYVAGTARIVDHSVYIRINLKNTTPISDPGSDGAMMVAIRPEVLGLNTLPQQSWFVGSSDGLNAVCDMRLTNYTSGGYSFIAINIYDWITRSTTLPGTLQQTILAETMFPVTSHTQMLDSACDRFIFKRTA